MLICNENVFIFQNIFNLPMSTTVVSVSLRGYLIVPSCYTDVVLS